jgi:hypothetical protein
MRLDGRLRPSSLGEARRERETAPLRQLSGLAQAPGIAAHQFRVVDRASEGGLELDVNLVKGLKLTADVDSGVQLAVGTTTRLLPARLSLRLKQSQIGVTFLAGSRVGPCIPWVRGVWREASGRGSTHLPLASRRTLPYHLFDVANLFAKHVQLACQSLNLNFGSPVDVVVELTA